MATQDNYVFGELRKQYNIDFPIKSKSVSKSVSTTLSLPKTKSKTKSISSSSYEKLLKIDPKLLTKSQKKQLDKMLKKKYCSCVIRLSHMKGKQYGICTSSIYNKRNITPPKNKNKMC